MPPGRGATYHWLTEKQEVVVWFEDGRPRVFSSLCPHMGGQLCPRPGEGALRCSWHPLVFDARTGRSGHKRYPQVREYAARIEGRELVVSD